MTSIHRHVEDPVSLFGRPRAGAAEPPCDRHPGDAVAVTVVPPGLSWHDWTSGEPRARSGPAIATRIAATEPGRRAEPGPGEDIPAVSRPAVPACHRTGPSEVESVPLSHPAAHACPRIVHCVPEPLKTPSGKLRRSALRHAQRRSR